MITLQVVWRQAEDGLQRLLVPCHLLCRISADTFDFKSNAKLRHSRLQAAPRCCMLHG